jgi:transglutaminase-like putative cysteine protease
MIVMSRPSRAFVRGLVCRLAVVCLTVIATGLRGSAAEALPAPEAEEQWQVIYLSGQRVGYARTLVSPVTRDGETFVRTEADTHLTLKRFGQVLKMSTATRSEETLAGDLRTFEFTTTNPPASTSVTSGKVEGTKLAMETTVNNKTKTNQVNWKVGVKTTTYQDRLMRNQPLKPGEKQSFEAFFPEFAKIGTVKLTAGDFEEVELLNDQTARLQKLTMTQSLVPGIKTHAWVDETGRALKTRTSLIGTDMVSYTVSEEEAIKALTVEEIDLGVATLVKTKRIPNAHETKQVTYHVTIPDEDPAEVLPAGDSQKVAKVSDHVAEVTVTAVPLVDGAKPGEVDAVYTATSQYIQTDDVEVRKHATQAAGELTDAGAIARAMEAYVSKTLDKKNYSTALASAGEVARELAGDCTEHAVLLAAMLRTKGIPARVVVGLVYVDSLSAFGGHMWTEANLDGVWVPLDATLGKGGIGGAHLKLDDASLDDADGAPLSSFASLVSIIGKLQIDVMKVE